ncbi:Chromobox protein-like protein 1-like protein [Aphelenchoides fujianensis]|nr:Chromobox protein-like protein 1-like protein [Aphelenchoides fujianensis]
MSSSEGESENQYVVEKILDKRIKKNGKIEYFIKWQGAAFLSCFVHIPLLSGVPRSLIDAFEREWRKKEDQKKLKKSAHASSSARKSRSSVDRSSKRSNKSASIVRDSDDSDAPGSSSKERQIAKQPSLPAPTRREEKKSRIIASSDDEEEAENLPEAQEDEKEEPSDTPAEKDPATWKKAVYRVQSETIKSVVACQVADNKDVWVLCKFAGADGSPEDIEPTPYTLIRDHQPTVLLDYFCKRLTFPNMKREE